MNTRKPLLSFIALLGIFGSACGAEAPGSPEAGTALDGEAIEGDEIGTTSQAWSVISCGRENVSPHTVIEGHITNAFDSPASYNKCTKSYVLDVHELDASHAGTGRDRNASFYVGDLGPVPTNQADCEALEGGAIFYERVGNAWVPLTEQVVSSGLWGRSLFGPQMVCYPPAVSYGGDGSLEAGTTYRIAATYRNAAGETRPIRFETLPPVTIR